MVAKRMRRLAEELEGDVVDVRRDDKVIRSFTIPAQKDVVTKVLEIKTMKVIKDHEPVIKKVDITLKRTEHLQLLGPNGIGKSTLLEALTQTDKSKSEDKEEEVSHIISPDVRVGYYRQDFSTLNFEDTPREALLSVMEKQNEQDMRTVAAGFLIGADVINTKIGNLSEGQKGLVAFARLVLMCPGLLVLDEPTNHINFRHLPVIAAALSEYKGAMIIVSHVPEFISQIRIDQRIDLQKVLKSRKK